MTNLGNAYEARSPQGGRISSPERTQESADPIDYVVVEEKPRFRALTRKRPSFVYPLAAAFLIWWFVHLLLPSFAPDFMAQRVSGDITVRLLFGLGPFAPTFIITMLYVCFANRRLEPIPTEIRHDLERQGVPRERPRRGGPDRREQPDL